MSSAESSLASIHCTVRGQVQGVFFRAFVQHHAEALRLTGYTRNLPAGNAVEVHAEGEREQLEILLQHLHQGPRSARVKEVETKWGDHTGGFTNFEVAF